MSEENTVAVTIEQIADFEFRVRFEGTALADLTGDEPAPLGHDAGPNPTRLLLAAIANCLASSLLFALRKFRNTPGPLRAQALAKVERNAQGRLRVAGVEVDIRLTEIAGKLQNLERALTQFENFCVVTESVRAGVPVTVRVHDGTGAVVHANSSPA